MKFLRPALTILAISLTLAASGQVYRGRNRGAVVPPNPQALSALQLDLINAIELMKTALPIYDGNRVRSIHQAHEALLLVDQAIAGVNAVPRAIPVVKDTVASTSAHTKYTKEQIASSQATMRKAHATLQQAYIDLKAAAGSNPNPKAVRCYNHLNSAGAEATKAIAIHAAQG